MAQRCTICKHSERLEIDRQIVKGVPYLKIANYYDLTPSSMANHAKKHLSRQLLKSHDIAERANADVLLGEIDMCLSKTKDILAKAEEEDKPTLQLQAIREIRQTIEFLSRLAVSMAQLQLEKESQENTTIIRTPKIASDMSSKEALALYKMTLLALNDQKGKGQIEVEYIEQINDSKDEHNKKMKRTTPVQSIIC